MDPANDPELNKEQSFLEALRKEVDENLTNEQFGVEELARAVGLSRSQLHRKLTSTTGQSVSQFIREYRLQLGMSLLKDGRFTAAEVSDRIGFGSPTYFNKCFNDYYGFPPGEAKNRSVDVTQPPGMVISSGYPAPVSKRTVRTVLLVLPVILIIAIVALFLFNRKNEPPGVRPAEKSIAILPFKNLSDDERNEYFTEGVIEAIRTSLSQVGDLTVISRTSVEQYRESPKSAREISDELNVATLLEGSVQRNDNQVRLEVRLVDGATEGQLWSKSFDRELKDVFTIQNEIAESVARELNAELSKEERSNLSKSETHNPEAYDLLLKGVYEYRTYTNTGIHNSIEYLHQAIDLDTGYARAYAALANSYVGLATIFGAELTAIEALEKGAPLISRALELDPDLDEALMIRGFYLLYHDWDFDGAETEYIKAIRHDHPDALALYIDYLNFVSRHAEALELAKRLNEKHPYYPNSRMILSYFYSRKFEDAMRFSDARLNIFNNYYTLDSHGFLLLQMKRFDEAIVSFNKAMAIESIRYPRMLGWMGAAYAGLGNRKKSMEVIDELRQRLRQNEGGSIAFFIAVVYSALGEKEHALQWLHTAYESHDMEMPWLLTEPQFYNLHEEPEFREIAQKMNFPQVR